MASFFSIVPGSVLTGRYEVQHLLGRGGMASVVAAVDRGTGERVALKVLSPELASSPSIVERFVREGEAIAELTSPNICQVREVARREDGIPFLVLELLEGEALFDALQRETRLPVERVIAIVTQVCRGLSDAHAAGVVHRDLKPENILLCRHSNGDLLVKLIDFGLARFERPVARDRVRLTRPGAVFGTPAYMSPEQVLGQAQADARSDLWAVACIVYECLTGTTVWRTDRGVASTFEQIANAPLPDPRRLRPELPASCSAWFARALQRDPARRFQHAEDLARSFVASLDPGASASPDAVAHLSPVRDERTLLHGAGRTSRSNPRLTWGMMVGLFALAALAAASFVGGSWLR